MKKEIKSELHEFVENRYVHLRRTAFLGPRADGAREGGGGGAATLRFNAAADSNRLLLFSCAARSDPPGTHCSESTLPDGTRVVLTEGPSEDAGHDRITLRMADTYRPDGVRVVIGTWNAVREKTNTATRAEPPLSVHQLQTIATDPAWRV